jgi:DNA-binding XRE family transcriptional regulator
MKTIRKSDLLVSQVFLEMLPVYLRSPESVQTALRECAETLEVSTATEGERWEACRVAAQYLFEPQLAEGQLVSAEEFGRSIPAGLREAMHAQDQSFVDNLKRLMNEKGLTQAQLAQAVGVRPSAMSMLLKRRRRPQRRTLEKLAAVLGVAPQELWPPLELASRRNGSQVQPSSRAHQP